MTRGSIGLLSYVLAAGLALSTAFGPSPAVAQSSCDGAAAACEAAKTDVFCTQQYINDLALCYYCQTLGSQVSSYIAKCNGTYSISNLTDPSVSWNFPPTTSNATASSINVASITNPEMSSSTPTSTATTIQPQPQPSTNVSSQLSTGVIVGIAIGSLAIIVIFGLLIWACQRRNAQPSPQVRRPPVTPPAVRQQKATQTQSARQQAMAQTQTARQKAVHPVYAANDIPIDNGGAIGSGSGNQPIIGVYSAAAPPPYNPSMKTQFLKRFSKDS